MKSTKKNGAKRNPILALAILGLLVGAGATGALAAGLIPNLDTGVSGSVSATVTTDPLLTVGQTAHLPTGVGAATVDTTYNSDTKEVKFSSTTLAIAAPGSATFYLDLTVHRLGSGANAILINMKGIDEYTIVSLTATTGNPTAAQPVENMGGGEWAITNPTATSNYTLAFNVYVSQQTIRVDGAANPMWDFSISEATVNLGP